MMIKVYDLTDKRYDIINICTNVLFVNSNIDASIDLRDFIKPRKVFNYTINGKNHRMKVMKIYKENK